MQLCVDRVLLRRGPPKTFSRWRFDVDGGEKISSVTYIKFTAVYMGRNKKRKEKRRMVAARTAKEACGLRGRRPEPYVMFLPLVSPYDNCSLLALRLH